MPKDPKPPPRTDPPWPTPLEKRILELRGSQTKRAFAKLCGVEYTDLYRYERGNVRPGTDVMMRIAAACGVRVEWLATGETPKRATRAA